MEKIYDAIEFAIEAHHGQVRKGSEIPYIRHPIGVGKILHQIGCTEAVIVSGILHDCIEDTKTSQDEIRKRFGDMVSKIVIGCSEPNKADTWENRKKHTIESLKTASSEVLVVTCADKLDNLREIHRELAKHGDMVWSRFKRGKEDQKWYFHSLIDAVGQNKNKNVAVILVADMMACMQKIFSSDR